MHTKNSKIEMQARARAEKLVGIDSFIKQITHVVPGWLHPGNVWNFRYALEHLPKDAALLEIGSFSGLSTVTLLYLIQKSGLKNSFFTCDPWADPPGPFDEPMTDANPLSFGEMRNFVRDSFVRNVAFFHPHNLPASFQMTSDEFFASWDKGAKQTDLFGRTHTLGGPLSFVYVDGNHDYSYIKRDFENADRLLEPGGFVLFDDSGANGTGGPSRVAAEVALLPHYELIHHSPNALFRKRT